MKRQYPTLEHFEIVFAGALFHEPPKPCAELLAFFHQNPNVRMFSTDSLLLLAYRDLFLGSNIKLDRLFVSIHHDLDSVCKLTNDLHEQGFYKKLHLQPLVKSGYLNKPQSLWSFRNVEKIFCSLTSDITPLSVVESVVELGFEDMWMPFPNFLTFMPMRFSNLRRVNMKKARLSEIQSFVSHAPKLAQIRMYISLITVKNGRGVVPSADEFFALNEARENLAGACKVVIYVQDKLFMKMKWSSKVKFSMIELKRISSCEIEHNPMKEWQFFFEF